MRTMMRVTVPVQTGNRTISDGSLPRIMQATLERLKPEAAYFVTDAEGSRQAIIVFDLKDPSEIPTIAEPLFGGLDAQITFAPVMNAQDLQQGLSRLAK